jgi:CO dehydrogenase maturation factor
MKTIAIAGKGGTGKTTLAAMIIRLLSEKKRPILAVDADSNVNLNEVLGVELREEMKILSDKLPAGMSKQQFLEYKIQRSLVEAQFFDLIAMGRPEGPGCYCYANNLLRDILRTLSQNYEYVVIDNQAGMEHLSRRTTQDIDELIIVSDPSLRGIHAAGKISRLVKELETRVKHKFLILNRIHDSISVSFKDAVAGEGLKLLSFVPEDKNLLQMDQEGKSIWEIPAISPSYKAIVELCQKIIITK